MCADPKMRGLLMQELRGELASRRRARAGDAPGALDGLSGRKIAAFIVAVPMVVAVALAASYF